MSVLDRSLPIHNKHVLLKDFETNWNNMEECFQVDSRKMEVSVSQSDTESCKDTLPVIVYLAGYCSFAVLKKKEVQ